MDETSEDETSKDQMLGSSRSPTPLPIDPRKSKPPPIMSSNIRLLLDTLEFNQIDMYRYVMALYFNVLTNLKLSEIFISILLNH